MQLLGARTDFPLFSDCKDIKNKINASLNHYILMLTGKSPEVKYSPSASASQVSCG
jgi:hypothetical protein